MSDCPFSMLQDLYSKTLHLGRFAGLESPHPSSIGDLHFPTDEFRASVTRYLAGDVHELDVPVALHLRNIASADDLSAKKKRTAKQADVRHFCASVLLTHFSCFDGGGFGHNEMPLVIATAVVGGLPDWAEPSAAFLTALLDGRWEQGLDDTGFFIELALACMGGASTRSEAVLSPASMDEAVESNIDGHVPLLAAGLLARIDGLANAPPPAARRCLAALAKGSAPDSHDG